MCVIPITKCEIISGFFHNLRRYDYHHFSQGLRKYNDKGSSCIATSQSYVTFAFRRLVPVSQLVTGDSCWESVQRWQPNPSAQTAFWPIREFFSYARRVPGRVRWQFRDRWTKRVYPLVNTANRLILRHCTDYMHAQDVWAAFNMRAFGKYHGLYLLTDVLLLAKFFEKCC